jgi:protease I
VCYLQIIFVNKEFMRKKKIEIKGQVELMDAVLEETKVEREGLIVTEEITLPQANHTNHRKEIRVAILSEDGFEEIELTSPKHALEEAGIKVDVISPHTGKIKSWDKTEWGQDIPVDKEVSEAHAEEYDALVLPGGVMNPDKLRQSRDAISFVRKCIRLGKTIAAICHGPQTLIETGMIEGKTMTSYPSLETDLRNAGVNWVDKDVVHYGQFITSRNAYDLDAFNRELLNELSPGPDPRLE